MRTPMQKSLGRIVVAMAVTFTLAVPPRAMAQEKARKSWKVKESKLRLRLTGERLVLFEGEREVESIPLLAISAMAHERHREASARDAMLTFVDDTLVRRIEQGTVTTTDMYAAFLGVTLMLPFSFLRKSRYVLRISWMDDGEKRTTGILLSKKDARDVFAELRRALGPEWKERAETITYKGSAENYRVEVEEDRVIPGPRRRPVPKPIRVVDLSRLTRDELFPGRPSPNLASRRNLPEAGN